MDIQSDSKALGDLVRKAEADYQAGNTEISKHVKFSLRENNETIDAYVNSKHTSGSTDSQGREKPFFNIVTAAMNVWYRATDIDRKNIRFKATKSEDIIPAFLANVILEDYMRRDNFGAFLNKWGRALARNGSAILKFVEKAGKLHAMVIPWSRIIVDAIHFDNAPRIEILELTEAQLRKRKGYDQEIVKNLIETKEARETIDGQKRDNKQDFIKLFEVHGELPLSYLTGKDTDKDTYVQQMHVVSYVAGKEKGKFDDFTLVSGKEEKDPNMITHLIEEEGRVQAIGAPEHLFEAQWMVNHTAKNIKDQLDLASKLIFQTSDGNFVGQNALSGIQNGEILTHARNQPLTQLANNSHDITSLQSFGQQWQVLANEITGVSESMKGTNPPSGTAWRQTEALLSESHSLFELMTENKGLHVEEMMRIHVIPYIKKQLSNSDEISAVLEAHDIAFIDPKYIAVEKHKMAVGTVKEALATGTTGDLVLDPEADELAIKEELAQQGNQRFFKPSDISDKQWKEIFKDFEWEIEVEVTNENTDKQATLTTLSTVLQTIAGNPAILQDPNIKMVFNKILEETGKLSPLELSTGANQATPQAQPQPNPTKPLDGIAPEGVT